LLDIVGMIESNQSPEDWYVEVFVRNRQASEDDELSRRFGRRGRGRRGKR